MSFRRLLERGVYTTTVAPGLSQSVARPQGNTAKEKLWCIPLPWKKQGKRVYTIGPERSVYTIEPQTPKQKKRRVSMVVVYTFFFSVSVRINNMDGSGFGSWKTVPVPLSVPGKTAPTVPVFGSGSILAPACEESKIRDCITNLQKAHCHLLTAAWQRSLPLTAEPHCLLLLWP